jgi:hypothetical protein
VIAVQIRVRDGSGILLWSDSGIKDTADSPTRSFYGGARQNKTTFFSISKKSISLANQKKLKICKTRTKNILKENSDY